MGHTLVDTQLIHNFTDYATDYMNKLLPHLLPSKYASA